MKLFRDEQVQVCKMAIEKYGFDKQLNMVIEECSELIKAICKYNRIKDSDDYKKMDKCVEDICEETADVLIMCQQILILFEESMVENFKNYKIDRLKERLD